MVSDLHVVVGPPPPQLIEASLEIPSIAMASDRMGTAFRNGGGNSELGDSCAYWALWGLLILGILPFSITGCETINSENNSTCFVNVATLGVLAVTGLTTLVGILSTCQPPPLNKRIDTGADKGALPLALVEGPHVVETPNIASLAPTFAPDRHSSFKPPDPPRLTSFKPSYNSIDYKHKPSSISAKPGYGVASNVGFGMKHKPGPQPGYGVSPRPGYGVTPKPGYGLTPKPGYGLTPKSGYGLTPKPGYGLTPKPGYRISPKPGYEINAKPGYGLNPKPGYGISPKPGFGISSKPGYVPSYRPKVEKSKFEPDKNIRFKNTYPQLDELYADYDYDSYGNDNYDMSIYMDNKRRKDKEPPHVYPKGMSSILPPPILPATMIPVPGKKPGIKKKKEPIKSQLAIKHCPKPQILFTDGNCYIVLGRGVCAKGQKMIASATKPERKCVDDWDKYLS